MWALDFAFDQTAETRVLEVLTTTDEFTEKALALKVQAIHHRRSIDESVGSARCRARASDIHSHV